MRRKEKKERKEREGEEERERNPKGKERHTHLSKHPRIPDRKVVSATPNTFFGYFFCIFLYFGGHWRIRFEDRRSPLVYSFCRPRNRFCRRQTVLWQRSHWRSLRKQSERGRRGRAGAFVMAGHGGHCCISYLALVEVCAKLMGEAPMRGA